MKRFKLNFAVVAFVLGSVIAITQSAFTPVAAKRTSANYHFKGTTTAEMSSASNYEVVTDEPDCPSGTSLPCEIDNISGDLQTWLNARNNTQILAAASVKKDAE